MTEMTMRRDVYNGEDSMPAEPVVRARFAGGWPCDAIDDA